MKIISSFLSFAVAATLLLGGCKGKDGDPGPAGANGATGPVGPSGQNLTGSIIGFVEPRDEFGRPQAKNGVTVSLENVTPAVSVTTDANGRYELSNVRSGTYNIAFSKAGYGTTKIQGYPHAGGDQPAFLYTQSLEAISTTTVPSFGVGRPLAPGASGNYTNDFIVPVSYVLVNGALPSQNNYGLRGLVFVGATSSVSSTTGTFITSLGSSSGSNPYYGTDFFSRSDFARTGLASGTTAYAIVYGSSGYYSENGYRDLQTGRLIYTSLSATPSQVVSFIVP